MMVPSASPDLDKADAALDEAAGDEELIALGGAAVGIADSRGFFVEVEGVGGFGLHFEGHFVGLEAGFELGVFLEVLAVQLVELVDEVKLAGVVRQAGVLVVDVFDELVDLRDLGINAERPDRGRGGKRIASWNCRRGSAARRSET